MAKAKKIKEVKKKIITISIPKNFDKKIKELIQRKKVASRSQAIRFALRDYLSKEFKENLEILGYSIEKKKLKSTIKEIKKIKELDLRLRENIG